MSANDDLVEKVAEWLCNYEHGAPFWGEATAQCRDNYRRDARAVLSLLQPRLDAADELVRAAERIKRIFRIDTPNGDFSKAIAAAKAAGLGRMKK